MAADALQPPPTGPRLIKYLETLARRTYENQPVALNLIIAQRDGSGRHHRARDSELLRPACLVALLLPCRGRRPAADALWRSGVGRSASRAASYKFHPEFLHPIHSVMDDSDLSAHLTAQGDLIIMSKAGLLATRRKRKWKIYDVRTFKNSLSYCLGNHYVGANLFEVVFDLSFRRQGSLLIYDPEHLVADHILNPESILAAPQGSNGDAPLPAVCGQALIGRSIEDISVGKKTGALKRKRRLIEMACVDGRGHFRRQPPLGGRARWCARIPAWETNFGARHHRRPLARISGAAPDQGQLRRRRDRLLPQPL